MLGCSRVEQPDCDYIRHMPVYIPIPSRSHPMSKYYNCQERLTVTPNYGYAQALKTMIKTVNLYI